MDERSWYRPKALRISHKICPQMWQRGNDSDCMGKVWPLSTAHSINGQDWMAEVHGWNGIKGNSQHSREAQEVGKSKLPIQSWCAGWVTRLLEVTHGQWLYRNVHLHDTLMGDLITRKKEDSRQELLDQIELGGEGLGEEDKYLLEINLEELDTSSGDDQTYWLLSLRAARVAFQIRESRRQNGVAGEEASVGVAYC